MMHSIQNKRIVIFGGVLAMALTAIFFSLFFNRFAGLRSGDGEFAGGYVLVHGSMPFRDYFSASPPLNQFKSGILLSLFGEKLIVSRAAGLVERSFIALIVYLWLLRLCRPAHAAIAAFATLVISTADFADPIASYNHDCIFFAIVSGYLASFILDRYRSVRSILCLSLAAGLAAGLSLLTKQTVGLGAVVAVPVVVATIVWRLQTFRRALVWLIGFGIGAAMPVVALLIWIATLGSLKAFLVAIFVKGPAAKAQNGAGDFVTRAIQAVGLGPRALILALSAALISVWLTIRSERSHSDQNVNGPPWEMPAAAAFGIASIALGVFLSFRHWGHAHHSWPGANTISLMIVALVVLLAFGTWQLLNGTQSEYQAQIYLMAAVSFNIAFMLSLSYPCFTAMLLPGIGLLVAGSLAASRGLGRLAVYAVVMLLCVDVVRIKLDIPFQFGFLVDGPVSTATVRSDQPKLRGMLLPAETARLLDGVAHIVASNTTPSDTIFAFPEMGLFYPLTDRRWPTESGSHNVDVVSDSFAEKEAARLLANPPKVLIYHPQTEEQSHNEEITWRNGHRMGQRDIAAAVETLAKNYRLAGVYPTLPENQDVYVYVRAGEPAIASK